MHCDVIVVYVLQAWASNPHATATILETLSAMVSRPEKKILGLLLGKPGAIVEAAPWLAPDWVRDLRIAQSRATKRAMIEHLCGPHAPHLPAPCLRRVRPTDERFAITLGGEHWTHEGMS